MSESRVVELQCNIDDMTAEAVGYAIQVFMDSGARDAYATPIVMKKSRPGLKLTVMCTEEKRDEMVRLIFRHTTTIGIRELVFDRFVLDRTEVKVETPYGTVRRKDVNGYGISRSKYEFDDVSAIARNLDISYDEARKLVEEADRSGDDR